MTWERSAPPIPPLLRQCAGQCGIATAIVYIPIPIIPENSDNRAKYTSPCEDIPIPIIPENSDNSAKYTSPCEYTISITLPPDSAPVPDIPSDISDDDASAAATVDIDASPAADADANEDANVDEDEDEDCNTSDADDPSYNPDTAHAPSIHDDTFEYLPLAIPQTKNTKKTPHTPIVSQHKMKKQSHGIYSRKKPYLPLIYHIQYPYLCSFPPNICNQSIPKICINIHHYDITKCELREFFTYIRRSPKLSEMVEISPQSPLALYISKLQNRCYFRTLQSIQYRGPIYLYYIKSKNMKALEKYNKRFPPIMPHLCCP